MTSPKVLKVLEYPHKIDFWYELEDGTRERIISYLVGIADLTPDSSDDDWEPAFVLNDDLDTKDYYLVASRRITSKVKVRSGDYFYPEEIITKQFLNDLENGKYDKKLKNFNDYDSKQKIIWDGKPFDFSYPYQGGFRKLRLDHILYNPEKQGIYWKCFCYMKKTTRTFKQESFKNAVFINDKEYSMNDFYIEFLKVNPETGEILE
ncbi:hypothetical protein L4F92_07585 [Avibacterium sp. 21-595]|uniref:hypothetical protein n=1 Tax=Avibacterium sp. 21-595 TaxID=2911527 RepID=UPI0020262207|nr:hypothetical protein [Avibacterium sp. 21-595]URL05934.1 hypothetical protein L4F92_07585 [Avibacterium sp. 21-595]